MAPLSTRSLIDDDVLLAPVFRVDIPDPSEHKDPLTGERYTRAGEDWSAEEAEQIMSPHTRAIAAKWRALCDAPASDGGYDGAQPPTIVQAATIDHAGALADAFRRAARADGSGGLRPSRVARQGTSHTAADAGLRDVPRLCLDGSPIPIEPTVAKRKTQPTGAAQADAGSTPAGRRPSGASCRHGRATTNRARSWPTSAPAGSMAS